MGLDFQSILRILISFVVGALWIGGLARAAEVLGAKGRQQLGGLLLAMPSTIVIGLFFIQWANEGNPAKVHAAVVNSFAGLGLCVLFPLAYLAIARWTQGHRLSFAITIISTPILWLAFAEILILIRSKYPSPWIAIAFCFLSIIVAHFGLRTENPPLIPKRPMSLGEWALKAIIPGLVLAGVAALSKVFQNWSGILAMFPAAIGTSLVLLHGRLRDPHALRGLVQGVPLGSLAIATHAGVAAWTLPRLEKGWGSFVAFLCGLAVTWLLSQRNRFPWNRCRKS